MIPSFRLVALGLTLFAGLPLLAGCGAFRDSDLAAFETPDCTESAGSESGLGYWVFGETGSTLNWTDCNQENADLEGDDLNIGYLQRVNLDGADLRDADLVGAKLGEAKLRGADLRGARLVGADLLNADLAGANLSGVDLQGISLAGVNLRDANLTGVNLRGVNLRETILEGADLSGAQWIYAPAVCPPGSIGACQ